MRHMIAAMHAMGSAAPPLPHLQLHAIAVTSVAASVSAARPAQGLGGPAAQQRTACKTIGGSALLNYVQECAS
jgi:hypothetical protein